MSPADDAPSDDEDPADETPDERATAPDPEERESADETADTASMAEYDPETEERLDEPAGDDSKYCHACGTEIAASAAYCPDCGARQDDVTDAGESGDGRDVDRVTAGIFAILLGGLGVHHFYLGNVGLGVLYLCFSWTFIPALVGVIEGIVYLTKTDEEFQRQYGGD
ncbi:TM2 domain-containing protein [Halomicroarcula sp. F13]|uniref:TM2 domain-containing protein n=1 Tax=Haloarcula rubra TaxID=2487747 RepID=A0AAW4PMF8_9EURY|nr:NINE protein [Halomicroarcula rubra]MBX0322748.1 TM2 domain-containing protein [Halomicroarcula rubra]